MRKLLIASQLSYVAFLISGIRNIWLARVLLPEELAANSLSSLLIALGLFMDFGAVYSIKRLNSGYLTEPQRAAPILGNIKNSMVVSLTTFGIILGSTGVVLVSIDQPELSIGFLAAGVILPIQARSNLRNASYIALGKNVRGSAMMLVSVAINFVATIALLPILHELVIIATPVIGYLLGLGTDSMVRGKIRLPKLNLTNGFKSFRIMASENMPLSLNQILAFSLVTIESWLAFAFLGLKEAATLGLIANVTVAISVFPITFSNHIQSRIAKDAFGEDLTRVHRLLRHARIFLLDSLAFVSMAGAICMTLLIQFYLPIYQNGVGALWVMVLSTFLYGSTFYTSSYAIVRGVEKRNSRVQLLVLVFVLIASLSLALVGELNLLNLCWLSVCKSLLYIFLNSKVIFQTSSGALVKPTIQLGSTLLRAIPVLISAAGLIFGLIEMAYAGIAIELVLVSLRLAPSWKYLSRELAP
jgi:hypothetical protein